MQLDLFTLLAAGVLGLAVVQGAEPQVPLLFAPPVVTQEFWHEGVKCKPARPSPRGF